MELKDLSSFQINEPEKVLEQYVCIILDELKKEYSESQNLHQKLNTLKAADPEIHSSFNKFHIAWMAYSFTRQDKELKMKMEDVWEGQLSMYRQVVEAKIIEIADLMKTKYLDPSKILSLSNSLF